MLIRLLDFENFVRHHAHRLVRRPALVIAPRHVEEAVLQRCSDRVVAMAIGLAAHGSVMVPVWLLLLLVSDRLLASVTWWL